MVKRIFNNKTVVILFCIAIAILGIWLRVDQLLFIENNYSVTDVNRDLLVGYHIAHYDEFTLLGPDSTSGLPLYNSSLFFILTAITGLIFGFSTIGINIGNLIYQLISVGLLFGTTKNFFNTRTAIFAATIMLLFDIFINQSGFYWQPHLMQVVFLTSLYFLSIGYAKKQNRYLYLSIFIFAASIGTHYPSVLVLPVYGIAVWMILFQKRAPAIQYIYTALFGLFSMIVVFGTAIFHKLFIPQPVPLPPLILPDFSIAYYIDTALYRTGYLISYYLPKADTTLLQIIIATVLFFGCVLYIATVRSQRNKYTFLLLVAAVVSVLVGVTIVYFPYETFVAYPLRYYTAVYVPLSMVIAVVLAALWSKDTLVYRIISIGIVGALLYFGGSYFGPQPEHTHARSQHAESQFLLNDKSSVQQINSAMLAAIAQYDLIHRFDVVTFDGANGFVNDRADDLIWFPLERMTNTKLVTLDDAYLRSYRPMGEITHILVRCREITQERCLHLIHNNLPDEYRAYQVIIEQLTSDPDTTYLLTR